MDPFKTIPVKSVKFSSDLKYVRSYKPHELGFDFPEIRQIFLDDCGAIGDAAHYSVIDSFFVAHTHKCSLEPLYNSVCVPKKYLRNSDDTPSDVMWHEYGHVLQRMEDSLVKHTEGGGHLFTVNGEEITDPMKYNELAHGEEWQKIMRGLGKPNLNTRFTDFPY